MTLIPDGFFSTICKTVPRRTFSFSLKRKKPRGNIRISLSLLYDSWSCHINHDLCENVSKDFWFDVEVNIVIKILFSVTLKVC